MNKIINIGLTLLAVITVSSCSNKQKPGKIYMPDMTYSRALETYAPLDSAFFTTDAKNPGDEIYYNSKPVEGTIGRV